jgi:2'-5' RNA ligase/N-acetylglutamate synthase-like GNAT family acetyltransferase
VAERHRLLVALLIGAPVADEIDGIRRALGSNQLERIPPHVTLIPPTNVAEDALDSAERTVREAAGKFEPVRLTLGPPDTFPDNQSVLFLTVQAAPPLTELRATLLGGPFAGRDRTDRAFVAHVTLDSRREPFVDDRMLRELAGYATSAEVATLALLEQDQSASLRPWSTLTSYDLAAERVVGRGGLEVHLHGGVTISPSLLALVAAWGEEPSVPEAEDRHQFFAVATASSEIVALATWAIDGDAVVLTRHVVAPTWRGLGIGTKLLSFVEELERTRARRAIVLAAALDDRQNAYYEGRGYRREERIARPVGRRPALLRRLVAGADLVD